MSDPKRTLLDGRTAKELSDPTNPLSTKCPGKWVLVDMETGDVWNGETMRRSDYADLALALSIVVKGIAESRTPLDVDGLMLLAPPENHDAIRTFMNSVGGQEWVTGQELLKLGYAPFSSRKSRGLPPGMQGGLPVVDALAILFHAVPADIDDKYNRPGARPE